MSYDYDPALDDGKPDPKSGGGSGGTSKPAGRLGDVPRIPVIAPPRAIEEPDLEPVDEEPEAER